jgi:hypothetical protein
MPVYGAAPGADELDIPVAGAQTYIVKVGLGSGTVVTEKVVVR